MTQFVKIKLVSLVNKQKLRIYRIEIHGKPTSKSQLEAEAKEKAEKQQSMQAQLSMLMMGLLPSIGKSGPLSHAPNQPTNPSLPLVSPTPPISQPTEKIASNASETPKTETESIPKPQKQEFTFPTLDMQAIILNKVDKLLDEKISSLETRLNKRIDDGVAQILQKLEEMKNGNRETNVNSEKT